MVGVLVNTVAVLVGSLIGLIFNIGIPRKITDAAMLAIGLCTLYIGISGSLEGNNTIVVIIAMVLGSILGAWIDIDKRLNHLAEWVEKKASFGAENKVHSVLTTTNEKKSTIAEGFVTSSLLFCVGAMTIVGSLNAGLSGDNEMLFTKSVLDAISSIMLSASLGVGVLFSSLFVLLFQGSLVLFAGLLQPILNEGAIGDLTCVGSLLILGLGLNLVGATKLKIANYLPALLFSPGLTYLFYCITIG